MSVARASAAPREVTHKGRGIIEESFPRVWPFVKLMRVNRPADVFITFWPFTWGLLLAANLGPISLAQTAYYLALFLACTVTWVGAGCAINDIWDRDLDAKVERCKSRPIASGEVTVLQALCLYPVLLVACLLLTLPLNAFCQKVVTFNIIPVTLYPVSKRVIGCPSLAFGLVVNWGALIGWSSVMSNLEITICGPLYFGAVCWTVMYDTIYGAQDKKGDAQAGIKSTALTLGSNSRTLLVLAATGAISGLTLAGIMARMEWPYYVGMLVATVYLGNQIFTIDLDDPTDCGRKYSEQAIFGLVVFLAMLAGGWDLSRGRAVATAALHKL